MGWIARLTAASAETPSPEGPVLVELAPELPLDNMLPKFPKRRPNRYEDDLREFDVTIRQAVQPYFDLMSTYSA